MSWNQLFSLSQYSEPSSDLGLGSSRMPHEVDRLKKNLIPYALKGDT
jgi:hypothetical protein